MKSTNIHTIPPKLNLDFADAWLTGNGGWVILATILKRFDPFATSAQMWQAKNVSVVIRCRHQMSFGGFTATG